MQGRIQRRRRRPLCVPSRGFENKAGECVPVQQGVDICQLARVSSSTNEPIQLQSSDVALRLLRPGSLLGVSFAMATEPYAGIETLLVPLQGTETPPSSETIVLSRSGSFALKLRKANSTQVSRSSRDWRSVAMKMSRRSPGSAGAVR